ncbi:zinc ribbon domain-containing protein [Variovorax sp. CCNWLW235]|uniref:zinc ribbon domain-containing protein n=1 Tax=Variovorax sp. CCNWLW235 TaxID=3127463 RepID=UPI0030786D72
MALICPVCSAENREGANFCRSCGGKLAPAAPAPMAPPPSPESRAEREWAATAPAQLRAPTIPGGLFDGSLPIASQAAYAHAGSLADEKTVIVGAGRSKRPPSPPREPRVKKASRSRTPRPASAEVRNKPPRMRGILLWLVLLAVGLLMIVAGWYGYGKGTPDEQAEAASPAVPVAAPAVAPLPASSAPEVVPPALPSAEPPAAADAALAAAATATPAAATPKSPSAAAKSRKPAPVAPSQPGAPEAAPAVAAAPAPQPAAAGPSDPQSICGDRNFIAKAQCMAAQCLKAEFKPHAQCEAVRRQQRIEEEKRNPTLVN